uniref:Protein tyrosine phosphatase n=1 Tax=Panagrolaimus sp. PS1159 TaxID=55785 RepID=A0AC35GEU9_9BILA
MALHGNHVAISTQKMVIEQLKKKRTADFNAEWKDLSKKITDFSPFEQFFKNESKNRYNNVYLRDETRVTLKTGEYIHASYIQSTPEGQKLIAAQAPLQTTTEEFWQMALQQKCQKIIMLCRVVEDGKIKSQQYWPKAAGETLYFEKIDVQNINVLQKIYKIGGKREVIKETKIFITDSKTKEFLHSLIHVQYENWQDFSIPAVTNPIIDLYHSHFRTNKSGSMIVHCSAGIGRTGCFVGAFFAYELFSSSQLTSVKNQMSTAKVIKKRIAAVSKLREQRVQAVQTASQYVFLHILFIDLIQPNIEEDLSQLKERFMTIAKRAAEVEKKRRQQKS